jgi:deoxyadenosine/deoxycytidine kinase
LFLAIAGNIGAGKSSLTRILAGRYALTPVYEAANDNPYLEDFYADMKRYAFHSQIFFLAARLEGHLRVVNTQSRVIQDRTVYEDAAVFARNLADEGVLDARDYASYCRMYSAVAEALRPPDLLLYLRAGLPTLRERIAKRGRAYEATISDAYLARLNALYDAWIEGYDLSDKVIVDADALDYVGRSQDLGALLRLLEGRGLSVPILP